MYKNSKNPTQLFLSSLYNNIQDIYRLGQKCNVSINYTPENIVVKLEVVFEDIKHGTQSSISAPEINYINDPTKLAKEVVDNMLLKLKDKLLMKGLNFDQESKDMLKRMREDQTDWGY